MFWRGLLATVIDEEQNHPIVALLHLLNAHASSTTAAALRITSITRPGFESMERWLLSTSVVVAPMRLATKRCNSGCKVRSFGSDLQAVPSIF
jgi:hypothetical protein